MNTRKTIAELSVDTAHAEHLISDYRMSPELPSLIQRIRDGVTAFASRPSPEKALGDMTVDQLYGEISGLSTQTLAFGDFHPDVCKRMCQLFDYLDEKMRHGERPRKWTNA